MEPLPPIPRPTSLIWRDFRLRIVPFLVFAAAVGATSLLWRHTVGPTTFIGQVEMIQATVISPSAGLITNLNVSVNSRVRAGDIVALIDVRDSRTYPVEQQILSNQVAVARMSLEPLVDQQRVSVDYHRLRIILLQEKVELATAEVDLTLADSELTRIKKLFDQNLVSEIEFDLAQKRQEVLQVQVREKGELIREVEAELALISEMVRGIDDTAESLRDTARTLEQLQLKIAVEKSSPVTLRAPISGVIISVNHRTGEFVEAGEPIITIASDTAERIVGYVRHPISITPEEGMNVDVTTRRPDKKRAVGRVLNIGAVMEPLDSPFRLSPDPEVFPESGLSITISLPAALPAMPGELVDLRLIP